MSKASPSVTAYLSFQGECFGVPVEWKEYIKHAISEEDGPERICILHINQESVVTSDLSLKPAPAQMMKLIQSFHMKRSDNEEIAIGSNPVRTYFIEKNDSLLMQTVGGVDGNVNEAMCAAKTKNYVILCEQPLEKGNGKCLEVIKGIQETLLSLVL